MNAWLWWLGQNTITVAAMTPFVLLACRVFRHRPAVQHVLWVVVLVKFLTPSIVSWPWTVEHVRDVVWSSSAIATRTVPVVDEGTSPADAELVLAEAPAADSKTTPRVGDTPDNIVATAEEIPHSPELPVGPQEAPIAASAIGWDQIALPLIAGTWVMGAFLCGMLQLRRIVRHAVLIRRGRPATEPLASEIRAIAKRLGVAPPRAVLARNILSPFLWCLGRLRLVWPESMASEVEISRSRGVIAHELAHIRRRDHWVAWLELAAGIVWWWNPLFWFVRRRLRESAEMACDALAIGADPASRRQYAEMLLELSAGFRSGTPAPVLAVGAGSPSSFERRMTMILSDKVSGTVSSWGILATIGFALIALPGWSLGQQTEPPRAGTPTKAEGAPTPPRAGESKKQAAPSITVFRLRNAKAEETAKMLNKVFGAQGVEVTADPRTNTVITRSDDDSLPAIRRVLEALDSDFDDTLRFKMKPNPGTDSTTPPKMEESDWSEPFFGMRIRMKAEKGRRYEYGKPLPLIVELQNIGDAPVRYSELHPYCRIEVKDEKGEWLGFAAGDVSVTPWEGSNGTLPTHASVRWTINFERMRLNKPAPGKSVQVRISIPRQVQEPGKLPRTVYSHPVTLELVDRPLTAGMNRLGETPEAIADKWSSEMDIVYREVGGLGGKSRAIHIDGAGNITLLDGTKGGRIAVKLDQKRLDRLAAELKQTQFWKGKDRNPAPPDSPFYQLSVAYGGSNHVGQFYAVTEPNGVDPYLQFQAAMRAIMDEAAREAEAERFPPIR